MVAEAVGHFSKRVFYIGVWIVVNGDLTVENRFDGSVKLYLVEFFVKMI